LTVREYFKDGNTTEKSMQRQMNFGKGWNGIGIQKERRAILAWSPNYGWEMNFKLEGYNECLITYVMAVISYTSNAAAYHGMG
jgi:hypothetical protein